MFSLSTKIQSKKFRGIIWGSIIDAEASLLILDIRQEDRQEVNYWKLDLGTLKAKLLRVAQKTWWSKIVSFQDNQLFISRYLDKNDPTSQEHWQFDTGSGEGRPVKEIRLTEAVIEYPHIFEAGSEYHKKVSAFLGLDLPLSCEYVEVGDKIILSYYLRSDKGFDRFLLVVDDGKKLWKEQQDENMKGFSSGSFVIYKHVLIFFKNRNEVCIYPV